MADQRPPSKAEEALTNAETAKAMAEINQIEMESVRLEAEIDRIRAEARLSAAKAETAEIDLAEARDDDNARRASDSYHRVYPFASAVSDASVKHCILKLTEWSRNDPGCEIEIVFNSPGGDVISGMALFDYILMLRFKGHKITTTALGMAASMAGILLQAGDVRAMGSEAWMLIHEGSFGASGNSAAVEDTVEWVKRIQKRILAIFANRSRLSTTQLAARWKRRDWWVSSDEALKMGLIDEVRGLETTR